MHKSESKWFQNSSSKVWIYVRETCSIVERRASIGIAATRTGGRTDARRHFFSSASGQKHLHKICIAECTTNNKKRSSEGMSVIMTPEKAKTTRKNSIGNR